MSEENKKGLQSRLWDIANTLRGKMGADEFRDYILGFIFYKYLSEQMNLFADEILKHDGLKFDEINEDSEDGQEMLRTIKEESVGRLPPIPNRTPTMNLTVRVCHTQPTGSSGLRTALWSAVACSALVLSACSSLRPSQDSENALPTALWIDATADLLESTGEWSNKVELADLNGDGAVDILFANGGNYSEPGELEPNRIFINMGPGERFQQRTSQILGPVPDLARVIKARDFDGDGTTDIFVGTTYQTQSRLFLGTGNGEFVERTATHLPQHKLSLGDVEPGDVDGDGDLDLVLADWGPENNMSNAGGRTRLWLNDGHGSFTDATENRMPKMPVRFSWDLEFVDVDNDFDLDILVSSKRGGGGLLFRNDGAGVFEHDARGLPSYTNNYEFEAMDFDGDGFLDLVTINDGEITGEASSSRREHIFRNDGQGRFRDATDTWWPVSENIGEDDNVVAILDYDSDGDADFIIGSLTGPDRLLINDGAGHLTAALDVFEGEATPGTLGMALADLDGDHRLDLVQAQGEVKGADQELVYLGRGLSPDTAPPVIASVEATRTSAGILVRARVHDRLSPTRSTDWRAVEVLWVTPNGPASAPLRWYGEFLWRAELPSDALEIEVRATDAAGNGARVEGVLAE